MIFIFIISAYFTKIHGQMLFKKYLFLYYSIIILTLPELDNNKRPYPVFFKNLIHCLLELFLGTNFKQELL